MQRGAGDIACLGARKVQNGRSDLARIAHPGGIDHATVEPDGYALIDDPFAKRLPHNGTVVPARDARLLAPVAPRTVVGMAHNTGPADRRLPPQAFLKPATTVTGTTRLPLGASEFTPSRLT